MRQPRSLSSDLLQTFVEQRNFVFRYESVAHFSQVFRDYYGPMHKAFAALDKAGQLRMAADLSELWAPTLVLWGERDPWLDPAFGEAYARRLPRAQFEPVPEAGHWPWLDQPGLVERVTAFLGENR